MRSIISLCISGALGAVLTLGTAQAGPNLWQKAAGASSALDPDIAHREAVRLYYEAELREATEPSLKGSAIANLQGARNILENAGARTSKDVRLRFDLGRVLSRLHDCPEAATVLQSALAMAPEHVQAAGAWFEIGICSAMVGNHVREEAAYLSALELEDEPHARASILANLAESRMGQGKLAGALEAIERSIEMRPNFPLSYWTLAIVKDRSGDAAGALDAARGAVSRDPWVGKGYLFFDGPGVFFEPDYERDWYYGLGELAHAENSKGDSEEYNLHLLKALSHFRMFVDAAPTTDPFRARAVERVDSLEKIMGLKKDPKKKK